MMKKWLNLTGALLLVGTAAQAQVATSDQRIPVHKDVQMTSSGDVVLTPAADSADIAAARAAGDWYRPSATACSNMNLGEAANVQMKTDLYDSATMISPNDAKRVALCAVPGQIGSGEMNMSGNRAEYEIAIIPNGKKTYSKVIVDAQTGAVLSTKQFGGARGFAGWVRESFEHKQNTP
jgi:uncharacterized membrane protein YkoI